MEKPDLLGVMRSWVDERGRTGQLRPWLVYREEPRTDRAKRALTVEIEDPSVMGQVTLWDTGECEIDLGSTTDTKRMLLRSVQVASGTELVAVLEEAIRFCEAESA